MNSLKRVLTVVTAGALLAVASIVIADAQDASPRTDVATPAPPVLGSAPPVSPITHAPVAVARKGAATTVVGDQRRAEVGVTSVGAVSETCAIGDEPAVRMDLLANSGVYRHC